jgi:hypothetical protein
MVFGINLADIGKGLRNLATSTDYDGGDWDENPQVPIETQEVYQGPQTCTQADISTVLEMVHHAIREKKLEEGSLTDLVIQVYLNSFVGGGSDSLVEHLNSSIKLSLNYESLRTVVRNQSSGDLNLSFEKLTVARPVRPTLETSPLSVQTFSERFMNQDKDPYQLTIDEYLACIGSQLLQHGYRNPIDAFKANQVVSLLSETPICYELVDAIITRMSMRDIPGANFVPLSSVYTDDGIIQDLRLCIEKASK